MIKTKLYYFLKSYDYKTLSFGFALLMASCSETVQKQDHSQQKATKELQNSDHPKSHNFSTQSQFSKSSITSFLKLDQFIIMGHKNGSLSQWDWPLTTRSIVQNSWLAHEQTIRELSQSQHHLRSLSADGTWAEWSTNFSIIKRGRIPSAHPNTALYLGNNAYIFGSDRGVVTKFIQDKRVWRTAGEHGRAVFGLLQLDHKYLLSVGSDGWLRCWTIQKGKRCGARPIHSGWITSLKPFHQGFITTGSNGFIKYWPKRFAYSLLKEKQRSSYSSLAKPESEIKANFKNISAVATHQNYILVGNDQGKLLLLSYDSEYATFSIEWSLKKMILSPITALLIDIKQRQVLVANGSNTKLTFVDLLTGQIKGELNL